MSYNSPSARIHLIMLVSTILMLTSVVFALGISSDSEGDGFAYENDLGIWDVQITGDNTVRITKIVLSDSDIETLEIPKTVRNEDDTKEYTVTEIGPGAGQRIGCKAQKIVIPNTIETIGNEAFYGGLTELKSIEFEDGSVLREIGDGAFTACGPWDLFVDQDDDSDDNVLKFPDSKEEIKTVEILNSGASSYVVSTPLCIS